jgi:hypothetical protein
MAQEVLQLPDLLMVLLREWTQTHVSICVWLGQWLQRVGSCPTLAPLFFTHLRRCLLRGHVGQHSLQLLAEGVALLLQ